MNLPAVLVDICGICRFVVETNWLIFSVWNSFIRFDASFKQGLLSMTYISSRVAFRDLVGMSKPYHSKGEVLYLILSFRRSIRSFSMTMS